MLVPPAAIAKKVRDLKLSLCYETPASVNELYSKQGCFCADNFVSDELEQVVRDAYILGDYEKMHCLTVRDNMNKGFAANNLLETSRR